jgi:hypothetical protein
MRKTLFATLALLISMSVAPLLADQAANVRTIAGILAKLNHNASADEKKQLQTIVDDKSASMAEHTVAMSIIGFQHKVTDADKAKLETLAKDAAAPAPLKTMATILVGMNHTPSAAEKETLTKLAAPAMK